MATSGVITFHACHNSGLMISHLGEGQYDHMGFFGPNGVNDAIIVGHFNDSTWIVDASGHRDPNVWGALVNNKYIDQSGVATSGWGRKDISDYQDELHTSSGTLLIWFRASGDLQVSTYNAKLFVFQKYGSFYDNPTDVTVYGFEINPSGLGNITEWSLMNTIYNGINFVDHSPSTGYQANQNEHKWWCAISCKANAVGWIDDFTFCFRFQYA
ncbi:MAG: hypothetical protein DRP85_00875 [Candidatus Makaraimicrobium thalassicum]|nr:MAG: hypothetical protein DRP85_00875 [Candidatus Omnitrophota bacterium]